MGTLLWRALDDLDRVVRRGLVDPEVADKLERVDLRRNSLGYDPWGFNAEAAAPFYSVAARMYRRWFRVETHGIDKVPSGRVLVIANHGGQVAWDGLMLTLSLLLDREPPRLARGMAERFLGNTPFLSWITARLGHVLGDPENCRRLLEADQAIMVFPEGVRGISKTIFERYELREFGSGFVRLAVSTNTPVVPVGIVGSEEAMPGLWNAASLGKIMKLPSFPVTPFFPWLGPIGALPLPTKMHFHFGDPIVLDGSPDEPEEDARRKAELVRARVQALVRDGLAQRKGIFS